MKDIRLKGKLTYLPCHLDKKSRRKLHLHIIGIHGWNEGTWLSLNTNKQLGGEKFKGFFKKDVEIIIRDASQNSV